MSALTRQSVAAIQNEVAAALKAIGEKWDLKLTNNRATYSDASVRFTLELTAQTEDGISAKYRSDWDALHTLYGFSADDLGKTFRSQGGEVRIVGLDTKRRKYPVACQNVATGKVSLFVVEDVLRLLGKPRTPLFR